MGSLFDRVGDFCRETLQRRHAGRLAVVDKHGNVEVAGSEGVGDVREVHTDFVASGRVLRIVGFNLNGAAVCLEKEVMRGGSLREAHALLATVVHLGVSVCFRLGRRSRLLAGRCADGKNSNSKNDYGDRTRDTVFIQQPPRCQKRPTGCRMIPTKRTARDGPTELKSFLCFLIGE